MPPQYFNSRYNIYIYIYQVVLTLNHNRPLEHDHIISVTFQTISLSLICYIEQRKCISRSLTGCHHLSTCESLSPDASSSATFHHSTPFGPRIYPPWTKNMQQYPFLKHSRKLPSSAVNLIWTDPKKDRRRNIDRCSSVDLSETQSRSAVELRSCREWSKRGSCFRSKKGYYIKYSRSAGAYPPPQKKKMLPKGEILVHPLLRQGAVGPNNASEE